MVGTPTVLPELIGAPLDLGPDSSAWKGAFRGKRSGPDRRSSSTICARPKSSSRVRASRWECRRAGPFCVDRQRDAGLG